MLIQGTQKAKDTKLVAHFTAWYCAAHHQNRKRSPIASAGTAAGIYGRQAIILCEECAEYIRRVEILTEKCPFDPKPFCTICNIKCYTPQMAEYARAIMRYSGPRSIFSRYWYRAIQHAIASKRLRKKQIKWGN